MATNQATELWRPLGFTEATIDECMTGCNSGNFASGETDGNTGCSSCCVFCIPVAFLGDLLKMPYSGIKAVVKACSKDVPQN